MNYPASIGVVAGKPAEAGYNGGLDGLWNAVGDFAGRYGDHYLASKFPERTVENASGDNLTDTSIVERDGGQATTNPQYSFFTYENGRPKIGVFLAGGLAIALIVTLIATRG